MHTSQRPGWVRGSRDSLAEGAADPCQAWPPPHRGARAFLGCCPASAGLAEGGPWHAGPPLALPGARDTGRGAGRPPLSSQHPAGTSARPGFTPNPLQTAPPPPRTPACRPVSRTGSSGWQYCTRNAKVPFPQRRSLRPSRTKKRWQALPVHWASNMAASPAGQLWGCALSALALLCCPLLSLPVRSRPLPSASAPVPCFHSGPAPPPWPSSLPTCCTGVRVGSGGSHSFRWTDGPQGADPSRGTPAQAFPQPPPHSVPS